MSNRDGFEVLLCDADEEALGDEIGMPTSTASMLSILIKQGGDAKGGTHGVGGPQGVSL